MWLGAYFLILIVLGLSVSNHNKGLIHQGHCATSMKRSGAFSGTGIGQHSQCDSTTQPNVSAV